MGEPNWTKEPPSEPGWYWCRRVGCTSFPIQLLEYAGDLHAWSSGESFVDSRPIFLDDFDDHEWWPVPIQAPALGSPEREGNDA